MVDMLTESPLALPSELGPLRVADYMAVPDDTRCELIFGRLFMSPSPLVSHQIVVSELFRTLYEFAGSTGGRTLFAPMDVTLASHSVVQPDVIYISPERRAIIRDRIEGVPDLLVEVLSPSTIRRDRDLKLRLYAETGVPEYWIIDPGGHQIEFLVLDQSRYLIEFPHDGIYKSPRLVGLELRLPEFWARVDAQLT
jgi:Uma2 family endonuclease